MTLNVSAASTPTPTSVVSNAGSTGAVNFDKFSTAPGSKRLGMPAGAAPKDTRVAMNPAVVAGGGAALLIAGVAVTYLMQRSQLESGPVIDARTSAALDKLLADKTDEVMQTLNGLKGVADFMQQPIPLPSREAVMKQLTSLYDQGKRAGGNVSQMAERFAQQLTGQGGGASSVPTVPQAQPRPAPSVSSPPRATPSAPAVNPVALQQARATMAAANTLTQANTVAPNAYAAMEKFYQAASGGRAARAAGALNAPLQSVRQAYGQLGTILTAADKQIAGSTPGDRALLGQWRDRVAQSRQAISKWLPGAVAFSQGRSKPNGPATANPTMPRLPGMVLEPPGAQGQGSPQGRRLMDQYTQAARQSAAPAPTTAATPTTAPSAPANTDQATQAMLTQSNAPLQRINTGVQAFYQQAAGGQAARQRGALAPSLKQVAEARAGLNKSILAANKLMADSSAQARPSLEAGLKNLRQARDAINAWLPQANAFAAGRSAPNGKRVAQPPLPATPTFVSTPANESAKDVAASWIKARNAAGNTLMQSADGVGAAPPSGTAPPGGITAAGGSPQPPRKPDPEELAKRMGKGAMLGAIAKVVAYIAKNRSRSVQDIASDPGLYLAASQGAVEGAALGLSWTLKGASGAASAALRKSVAYDFWFSGGISAAMDAGFKIAGNMRDGKQAGDAIDKYLRSGAVFDSLAAGLDTGIDAAALGLVPGTFIPVPPISGSTEVAVKKILTSSKAKPQITRSFTPVPNYWRNMGGQAALRSAIGSALDLGNQVVANSGDASKIKGERVVLSGLGSALYPFATQALQRLSVPLSRYPVVGRWVAERTTESTRITTSQIGPRNTTRTTNTAINSRITDTQQPILAYGGRALMYGALISHLKRRAQEGKGLTDAAIAQATKQTQDVLSDPKKLEQYGRDPMFKDTLRRMDSLSLIERESLLGSYVPSQQASRELDEMHSQGADWKKWVNAQPQPKAPATDPERADPARMQRLHGEIDQMINRAYQQWRSTTRR